MQIGDKVKIAVSSQYYECDTRENPRTIGEIIEFMSDAWIRVRWVGGYTNSYFSRDLELVENEVINKYEIY